MTPDLISLLVCEDVLLNPAGRLTLYNVFRDVTADRFPAFAPRFHVVSTWFNPGESPMDAVAQVSVVGPDGAVVGDAVSSMTIQPGAYYSWVARFRGLVFPEPGTYRVQVQCAGRQMSELLIIVKGEEEE
jgi:hypothetical protein